MTDLAILSPAEQKSFDAIPSFKMEERNLYFSITRYIRDRFRARPTLAAKSDFYYRLDISRPQVYPLEQFKQRDIDYVSKSLGLPSITPTEKSTGAPCSL